MRKALVGLCLFALATPVSATAEESGDFEAMAGACDAFMADGRMVPVSAEAGFFLERGFKGAASTINTDEVSRTYTRSGTPLDPVRIMVVRPAAPGGETCNIMDMNGPETGDRFITRARAESTWTFDSESNDVNGKGVLFKRAVGEGVIYLAIWGAGAAYPVSIASYQIGTSD